MNFFSSISFAAAASRLGWWAGLLAAALLGGTSGLRAQNSSPFTYTSDGKGITITGYTGTEGAVTVPATIDDLPVTAVESGAFSGRPGLTQIILPATVTSIPHFAFTGCRDLNQITLPLGLTSIGREAFYNCTSLARVVLPDTVTSLGYGAFAECTSLTQVTLPNGATAIGSYAFASCPGLTQITFPEGVTSIGTGVFWDCIGLLAIDVASANPNYTSMDGVLFDKHQTRIVEYPGGRTGSYTVPEGVKTIGWDAFSGRTGLTQIILPEGVATIGDRAFSNCRGLTQVTLPNGVTTVGRETFYNCTGLSQISFPESLVSIGYEAFANCAGLTRLRIPRSVTELPVQAFNGCNGLESVEVDLANAAWASVEGVLFSKDQTILWLYPRAKPGPYHLPGSVRQFSLDGCSRLTEVTLGFGVTEIRADSFRICPRLTKITFPATVTRVHAQAFRDCPNLTSVCFAGDAPKITTPGFPLPSEIFANVGNPTIYRLPGTMGWGDTFGSWRGVTTDWNYTVVEAPTALWLPAIGEPMPASELPDGRFGFPIEWAPLRQVTVEACADLTHPDWQSVGTLTLDVAGAGQFSDPNSANHPARLYRLRTP